MKLCPPALLYLLLSIIPMMVLIFYNVGISMFLVELFFIVLWTWVLNFFCRKGFSILSWFLVLTPIFIFTFLIVLSSYELTRTQNEQPITYIEFVQ
jgi:hypothetical protein